MKIDRTEFFMIQARFEYIPFTQTEEWLLSEYSDKLNDIVYFVDSLDYTQICCWGIIMEKPIIGKYLLLNGETIQEDIAINRVTSFYREIIDENFSTVEVSSINYYSAKFEVGIRRAGFIRPLGLSLCPLTLLVNLQEPFNFHRNWRRNVRKSIKESVRFQYIENPTNNDISSFIELFNQLKERKSLRYKLSKKGLSKLLCKNRYKLFFVYDKEGYPIAARIIYVMNKRAYDVYAANSEEALQCGATYFIQQEILDFLRVLKIEHFDYGRIPPGTDNMDSIYVSKSYSGGEPICYNGQWHYSKKKLNDFLYSFAKYLIRGDKRY